MLTNLYHKTPEAMAEGCREFVARGFKGLKIKVGDVVIGMTTPLIVTRIVPIK